MAIDRARVIALKVRGAREPVTIGSMRRGLLLSMSASRSRSVRSSPGCEPFDKLLVLEQGWLARRRRSDR